MKSLNLHTFCLLKLVDGMCLCWKSLICIELHIDSPYLLLRIYKYTETLLNALRWILENWTTLDNQEFIGSCYLLLSWVLSLHLL